MIIDNFEIWLLFRLYRAVLEKTELNAGDIAREFFKCDGEEFKKKYKSDKNRFISAKTNFVLQRIKRLKKENLIEEKITDRGKTIIIDNNKVFVKKVRYPDRFRDSLYILDKNNKWNVHEI